MVQRMSASAHDPGIGGLHFHSYHCSLYTNALITRRTVGGYASLGPRILLAFNLRCVFRRSQQRLLRAVRVLLGPQPSSSILSVVLSPVAEFGDYLLFEKHPHTTIRLFCPTSGYHYYTWILHTLESASPIRRLRWLRFCTRWRHC